MRRDLAVIFGLSLVLAMPSWAHSHGARRKLRTRVIVLPLVTVGDGENRAKSAAQAFASAARRYPFATQFKVRWWGAMMPTWRFAGTAVYNRATKTIHVYEGQSHEAEVYRRYYIFSKVDDTKLQPLAAMYLARRMQPNEEQGQGFFDDLAKLGCPKRTVSNYVVEYWERGA